MRVIPFVFCVFPYFPKFYKELPLLLESLYYMKCYINMCYTLNDIITL